MGHLAVAHDGRRVVPLYYTLRPISDRTWLRPASARERSRFTASWSDTLSLLERELAFIGGRQLIVEIDVREQDIKMDGTLRANARTEQSPAVVVAFESTHGPLQYRSDLYDAVAWGAKGQQPWQSNVRAIAMTLESLRAVDRYGATSRGEQYRGFKALPAGSGGLATGMTTEVALATIASIAGWSPRETVNNVPSALRTAKAAAHPDRNGGDRTRWDRLDQAEQVLARAGRLS